MINDYKSIDKILKKKILQKKKSTLQLKRALIIELKNYCLINFEVLTFPSEITLTK